MQEGFNPDRWDHWLVVVSYVALSGWIIWKIYLQG